MAKGDEACAMEGCLYVPSICAHHEAKLEAENAKLREALENPYKAARQAIKLEYHLTDEQMLARTMDRVQLEAKADWLREKLEEAAKVAQTTACDCASRPRAPFETGHDTFCKGLKAKGAIEALLEEEPGDG